MHRLIQHLTAQGPIVTDGAWGTQLQACGLAGGEIPDGWNLLHPERVLEVARSYVEAGSQIILTNTFGANRIRLAADNLSDKVVEINRKGAEISKIAGGKKAHVFASIGPTGKILIQGDVTAAEVKAAFFEQAQALAHGGADAIVVETMSDLEEAILAIAAAKSTGLPVVACVAFDSGKNLDRTMMGATPEQVAIELTDAGADVIGANCGQGITGFVSICKRLHAATDLPIWLKPNAGLPRVVNGQTRYAANPKDFATHSIELIKCGAQFVGGCCGTSPAFIRELKHVTERIGYERS